MLNKVSLKYQIAFVITILLGYIGKFHYGYGEVITIRQEYSSEFLTIVFGITSVIGTFVGLITVFASIDIQHKVEKSKELLWTLRDLHSEKEACNLPEDMRQKLVKLLRGYDFASSDEGQKSKTIISLAQATLLTIYSIWLAIIFGLVSRYMLVEFYIILLLLLFVGGLLLRYYNYLGGLRDFRTMTELPTLSQLLDANYDKGLKGVAFASALLSATLFKPKKEERRVILSIGLSPSFYNFTLLVEAQYYKCETGGRVLLPTDGKLVHQDIYLRSIRKKSNLGLDYSTHYRIAVMRIPHEDFDAVKIRFKLLSSQGMATTEFLSVQKSKLMGIDGGLISACNSLTPSTEFLSQRFEERDALIQKKDPMFLMYISGTLRDYYQE